MSIVKAKKDVSSDRLRKAISKSFCPDGKSFEIPRQIMDDISEIDLDTENFRFPGDDPGNMPGYGGSAGFHLLPGTQILVFHSAAGGDRGLPVAFFLYLGEDDLVHAYLPEDGNCYDRDMKRAWTPDHIEEFGLEYRFDAEKMEKEAAERLS